MSTQQRWLKISSKKMYFENYGNSVPWEGIKQRKFSRQCIWKTAERRTVTDLNKKTAFYYALLFRRKLNSDVVLSIRGNFTKLIAMIGGRVQKKILSEKPNFSKNLAPTRMYSAVIDVTSLKNDNKETLPWIMLAILAQDSLVDNDLPKLSPSSSLPMSRIEIRTS